MQLLAGFCQRIAACLLVASSVATLYVVIWVPDDTSFTFALKLVFVCSALAMLIMAVGQWLGERWAALLGVVGSLFGMWFCLNFGSEGLSIADTSIEYREFLDRAAWLIGIPFPFVLVFSVLALGFGLATERKKQPLGKAAGSAI